MNFYKILQTLDSLNEGSMQSAEKHKTGPKFTDYWKGTDSGTPGEKMVGSCEESTDTNEQNIGPGTGGLEEELMAAWEEFMAKDKQVDEAGANNPTPNSTNPVSQAQTAKELQTTQQNLNKLKSAGITIPTGIAQASQSAVKTASDPKAIPTAQDKNLSQSLGREIEQLLTKGDPGQITQIANVMKQVKSGM